MSVKASTVQYYCYFIQSKLNRLVLDVKGVDYSPNTPIIMWTKKDNSTEDADNQLWYFVDAGNGQYVIHSRMNGLQLAMDVTGSGETSAGTGLITYRPPHGSSNQTWSLQFNGDEAFIASTLGNNLVIDIKGADSSRGAEVIVWTKKESDADNRNQQWQFIAATETCR